MFLSNFYLECYPQPVPQAVSYIIKKIVGLNFVALITKLKISDAKDYLLNTNLSIEKIAEYVGYNNVDHFSRTFKKYYKQLPQQYRKLKQYSLLSLIKRYTK
ncbi:helix-turn-helix transcriptional regulator [Clostridium beijerinckii]|uniref:helix-turn-helix domain-containing protein n=1 Tax=Clostridium beijerinckii TaxID=1520 RepID=UPI0009BED1D3